MHTLPDKPSTEKPILFSAPMVRAILEGRKTQTRRVVAKSNSVCTLPFSALQLDSSAVFADGPPARRYLHVPAFAHKDDEEATVWRVFHRNHVGDRLWVRETFTLQCQADHDEKPPFNDGRPISIYEYEGGSHWNQPHYRATDPTPELCYDDINDEPECRWKPSIHMPRWASRITLEITAVRVERLQDISQRDAIAEGAPPSHPSIDVVSANLGYADFSRSWYAQLWNSINGPGSWDRNPWVWCVSFKRVPQ